VKIFLRRPNGSFTEAYSIRDLPKGEKGEIDKFLKKSRKTSQENVTLSPVTNGKGN
jgi:hypothetical protein